MELAARLRDLREDAGLTQTALAKPRYSVSYISQIESGRRKPSQDALTFLASKLGVTPGFLATGVPEDLEASLRYQLEEGLAALRESQAEEAARVLEPVAAQAAQYGLAAVHSAAQAAFGEAMLLAGRFRGAVEALEEAIGGDLPDRDRGMAVGNLARAYRGVGDLAYASDVIESYLNSIDRDALDPSVAADLNSVLLSVYFERGDVLRAERAAKRALHAAEQGVSPYVRATTFWHASRVLAEAKRWDEALDYASRARILMEEIEDTRRVGRLHNAYAFICLESEPPRTEEARWHLDRAQALLVEGTSAPGDLAYVFTERARLAVLEARFEDAVSDADRALEDAHDALEIARCLFLKGRAMVQLERWDDAADALRRAATLFGSRGARQQEASCWREIGEMHLGMGEVDLAVKALRSGLEALDPRRSRA